MQTLTDEFLNEKIEEKLENPYKKSIDILDFVSNHGKVIEKDNTLLTDGPTKKGKLNFFLEEELDELSTFRMDFRILTRQPENVITIKITAQLKIKKFSKKEGKGKNIFSDYHFEHTKPKYEKISRKKSKKILDGLKKVLKY